MWWFIANIENAIPSSIQSRHCIQCLDWSSGTRTISESLLDSELGMAWTSLFWSPPKSPFREFLSLSKGFLPVKTRKKWEDMSVNQYKSGIEENKVTFSDLLVWKKNQVLVENLKYKSPSEINFIRATSRSDYTRPGDQRRGFVTSQWVWSTVWVSELLCHVQQ